MAQLNEQQIAAHQAIGEVAADLGPSFLLEAVADALENEGRTEMGARGENLSKAVGILRQLADVLSDEASDE